MNHMTENTQKCMLSIGGKNLIQHKIDILPPPVTEVILVVGYLKENIINFFGDSYGGRKITYIVQDQLRGTGDSLWKAKDILKERFIVMMGDDIYSPRDIEECLKYNWSILVRRVDFLERGGKVILDKDNHLKDIVEGEQHDTADALVNTGFYVLDKEIFKYELVKLDNKEEWGLPQTLLKAARDFPIKVVESSFWIQITSPLDLDKAAGELLKNGATLVK